MNSCDIELQNVVKNLYTCDVEEGASRVSTSCMYPDGALVAVYVYPTEANKYLITDDGRAFYMLQSFGMDITGGVRRSAANFAEEYFMTYNKLLDAFFSDPIEIDQLESAITYMANMLQSFVTHQNERKLEATKNTLKQQIQESLVKAGIPQKAIARDYTISGESNKQHCFDYAIVKNDAGILIDSLNNHQTAIAYAYVKFNDVYVNHPDYKREAVIEKKSNWKSADLRLIRSTTDHVNFIEDKMEPLAKRYEPILSS